jgi:hypothetical protein
MSDLENLAELTKPKIVRLYLLGVYLLLRPKASLSRPELDIARLYFDHLTMEELRAAVEKILAELEARGIQPYHL